MAWITIEDEEYVIVIPETDSKPHGILKRKNQKTVDLAWLDCPCKPRLSLGEKDGVYEKPMVIHNSFEMEDAINNAMNRPFSSSTQNGI